MKVLYKTITAATQVYVGRCFLVGVEFSCTATAVDLDLIIYDEASADKTAGQKVTTLCVTPETQADKIMFPKDREPELVGIYAWWETAGIATVYYHL